jgi:hypothetical protein
VSSVFPIYVGFDPREAVAFHVCVNSIIRHSSIPVSIIPLALNTLPFYQEQHGDGSNAFIYSRFLVPYLNGYKGRALFVDGDMIFRADVAEILPYLEDMDVAVVKHDYKTKHPKKYLGNTNEDYPRKNWSSVILWNCERHKMLSPEFVQAQKGSYLHRFQWVPDQRIGELPKTWNWLVGEYEHNENAKLLHYTIGVPAFEAYRDSDHSAEWWHEFHRVTNVE